MNCKTGANYSEPIPRIDEAALDRAARKFPALIAWADDTGPNSEWTRLFARINRPAIVAEYHRQRSA